MILALPVVDGHDISEACIRALVATVGDPKNFTLVIWDNASEKSYDDFSKLTLPFKIEVIRVEKNIGYYTPLLNLFQKYPDNYIGLMHNDLILYTPNWDIKMREEFDADPKLGLVGLCGSNEIDNLGGRGGGTMCNFIGAPVQVGQVEFKGQDPSAGRRINRLEAACVLDSLFMMFSRHIIPELQPDENWNDITLAHFYDRIWPCRVIEAGYKVAVAPVDCDHIGGLTTTGNERYRQDCVDWLEERGFEYDNPETEMYLIAENRFLGEFKDRKKFIPMRVNNNHEVEHLWQAFN